MNNIKNKLNSKISWQKISYQTDIKPDLLPIAFLYLTRYKDKKTKQIRVNGPPSILDNTSHRVDMHCCAHLCPRRPEVWLFYTSPRSPPFSDHRKHPGVEQQTPSRCCQALQNLWTPYDSQAREHNNHSHFLSRHSQRSTAKK